MRKAVEEIRGLIGNEPGGVFGRQREDARYRFRPPVRAAADSGMFGVVPNYQLWSADVPLNGGVVKVTHPSAGVWVIEPQSPNDAAPLRSLGPNEAGFKIGAPEERRVHPGGNCDLGDWVMPFQLTLYTR